MRNLQSEGLIAIVPRRYSIVTRMSNEDAEDVCYARFVLEDASVVSGLGAHREQLADGLRSALEEMAAGARADDLDAVVDSDTKFHALLVDVSGRRRLKDLWSMLNSQMGALMRSSLERQGMSLDDTVNLHRGLLDAVAIGDVELLRAAIRDHYISGFPSEDGSGPR
jgi:DNA-binding GntR family transcriptional regulator